MLSHDRQAQERLEQAVLDSFDDWTRNDGTVLRQAANEYAKARGLEATPFMAPYVGERYALDVQGRPLRLAIVSMDAGAADHVDFAGRRTEFRGIAEREPKSLGKHLRGTRLALRSWLEPWLEGSDSDQVRLVTDSANIWQCFALLNVPPLAIVEPGTGRNASRVPWSLARQTAGLVRRLLDALEPTAVLVQGTPPRRALAATLDGASLLRDQPTNVGAARILAATHPSARRHLTWENSFSPTPYFMEVVAPFLAGTRQAAE